ncbi:MAG: NADH-quinone oxidoreductase subunit L [Dehalococcoidia bacterium]|nr:MAG: NADH-quinone oxidoreductase subunit L [Dehalococcoidia bacterium]
MGINIAFWVLALLAVSGALMVATVRSLFRTAMGLVLCFLSIAGLFITLSADFLGIVQVLIYIGSIAVLIIIAITLTREVECGNLPSRFKMPAIVSGIFFLGVAVWVMLNTDWPVNSAAPTSPTTTTLGGILFNQDGLVLAVEIAALLLLAAIIGAISVAREK